MAEKEWYRQTATRWIHFRSVPIKRLWVLIAAVFLLFSVFGFYIDLMYRGVLPYAVVLQIALYVGLNASLSIIVLSRLSMPFLAGLIVLQFFNTPINSSLAKRMTRRFDLKPVPSELGIHFAATATMSAIILSYVFFVVFIRREGRESFRMRNELELAHGIQKTLVPPVGLRTARFEIYGISRPSEKVGGDRQAHRFCSGTRAGGPCRTRRRASSLSGCCRFPALTDRGWKLRRAICSWLQRTGFSKCVTNPKKNLAWND